jgi:hypothetical protein
MPRRCGILVWKRLWFLALVLVALGGVYWYAAESGGTPKKVERMLRTELPVGSTRAQVEAWLDSHGFYHSRLVERDGRESKEVLAIIDPANVHLLWEGEIQISFYFDQDDLLIGHKLEQFTIGL